MYQSFPNEEPEAARWRELDTDEALDGALTTFWAHGDERTSIAGLTQAMGIAPSSPYAEGARPELRRRRRAAEAALTRRLERAREAGELDPGTSASHLPQLVRTLLHGMAVQSLDGASRAELDGVIDIAPGAWPHAGRGTHTRAARR